MNKTIIAFVWAKYSLKHKDEMGFNVIVVRKNGEQKHSTKSVSNNKKERKKEWNTHDNKVIAATVALNMPDRYTHKIAKEK